MRPRNPTRSQPTSTPRPALPRESGVGGHMFDWDRSPCIRVGSRRRMRPHITGQPGPQWARDSWLFHAFASLDLHVPCCVWGGGGASVIWYLSREPSYHFPRTAAFFRPGLSAVFLIPFPSSPPSSSFPSSPFTTTSAVAWWYHLLRLCVHCGCICCVCASCCCNCCCQARCRCASSR